MHALVNFQSLRNFLEIPSPDSPIVKHGWRPVYKVLMLSLDASNLETSPDQAQKWQVSMLDRQKVNIPGHVHVEVPLYVCR